MYKRLSKYKYDIFIFIVLLFLGIYSRLMPHPANFTPVGAIALFGGFYFRKKWKILAPLIIMAISDMFIGFYDIELMFSVYFCIFVNSVLGSYINKNKMVTNGMLYSFIGAIIFFLITNFSFWFFGSWYPHTFNGLLSSYYLAIPFFKSSLIGDLFFSFAFFSGYELISNYSIVKRNKSIKNV